MLAVNTNKAEAAEYMDTGYLSPFVVPPQHYAAMTTGEVSVWNVGVKTKRVLIGKGEAIWKRLSPNPDLWLYVVQVPDMEVIEMPFTRDVLTDLGLELRQHQMLLPEGVALHLRPECAADMGQTESVYRAGIDHYAGQIRKVWFDARFHLSVRFREKMISGKLNAAEWWQMAGGDDHGGIALDTCCDLVNRKQ